MTDILIIDDSPEDREQFASLLEEAEPGVAVVTAAGGRDGLARVAEQVFDCVLLDLRLDGEDGLDVLARLRQVRPDLPVIVFTGQGSELAATEAFVAGAAYYVPKRELTAKTLWTAVQRCIRQAATERELKAKQDAMERSNRLDALGQLAAGIAHDFNNQLGMLRYCIELLKQSATTQKSREQVQTALKVIDESASLATRLVALSRQGDLMARKVAIRETFSDLHALASASVSGRAVLKIDAPGADLLTYCDPGQLLNALLNLILNADDAVKAKGTAGTVRVSARREDDAVRIEVADDGTGMSEAVLARCCDPFFTTKSARNGTGLGMAMVQSFANDAGGEMLVQSTEGRGTKIILRLPVWTTKGEPDTAEPPVAAETPVGTDILVVDDQFLLADLTKEILENEGFSVTTAQDGESALEVFSSGAAVDLLLTDIKMPGALDGFELASRMRSEQPGLRVIYVTGYADNPEYRNQELLGPVLQKPVAPRDLIAVVGKVLAET